MSKVSQRAAKAAAPTSKRKIIVKPGMVDAKAYNEVVAKARLVDLRLVSSRSSVMAEALDGDRSGWEMKAGDELVDWKFEEEKGRLWARISFRAECLDGEDKPIIVEGDYLVVYGVDGEVDTKSANLFVARVARFACYPYFRTLFASLIGQASIVLPPLPVLKEPARQIPKTQMKASETRKTEVRKAPTKAKGSLRLRGKS